VASKEAYKQPELIGRLCEIRRSNQWAASATVLVKLVALIPPSNNASVGCWSQPPYDISLSPADQKTSLLLDNISSTRTINSILCCHQCNTVALPSVSSQAQYLGILHDLMQKPPSTPLLHLTSPTNAVSKSMGYPHIRFSSIT
jgi:hypothetical protein